MLDLGRTLLNVTERDPAATAIVEGGATLTCADWLDRVLRVAAGEYELERHGPGGGRGAVLDRPIRA